MTASSHSSMFLTKDIGLFSLIVWRMATNFVGNQSSGSVIRDTALVALSIWLLLHVLDQEMRGR